MSTTPPYRLGTPDAECRYPVLISDDDAWHIGHVFRWHGAWFAVPAGTDTETRAGDGRGGDDQAAEHLYQLYAAGEITAQRLTQTEAVLPHGPVPLLHWRMRRNATNVAAALKAYEGLAAHHWTPRTGYPGSDNPWFLVCGLCGWSGPRYWSHLRGRNGEPPSPHRHPGGCIGVEAVRARIPAYQR